MEDFTLNYINIVHWRNYNTKKVLGSILLLKILRLRLEFLDIIGTTKKILQYSIIKMLEIQSSSAVSDSPYCNWVKTLVKGEKTCYTSRNLKHEKRHPSPILPKGESELRVRESIFYRLRQAANSDWNLFRLSSLLYRQRKADWHCG